MKNKKIVIIVCITILVVLLGICFIYRYYIGNIIFNISMIGVSKDIIIEERGGPYSEGGYASTNYDYYVDVNKKKIYRIEIYYVYGVTTSKGEKGEHYTLKSTKNLTNEEVNRILDLTKLESNYSKSQSSNIMPEFNNPYYYKITYNNITTEIDKNTVKEMAQILDSMK